MVKRSQEDTAPETSDTQTTKKKIRQQWLDVTGRLGNVVQAGTEAATEAAVGTLRVATNSVTGMAQSIGENLTAAAKDATKVAQRSIDRFFSVLDSFAADVEEKPAGEASSKTSSADESKRTE